MTRPTVSFIPADRMGDRDAFRELFSPLADLQTTGPRDLVAVKIHPGEDGNSSFVSPVRVRGIVDALDLPPDRTFLTDTTVLYPGRRRNAADCMRLAVEHGFSPPATPPFIVADGLRGESERALEMPERFETRTAHIAELICRADAMVVISHFKGHLLAGFGGAVKNLGMGCASRAGKLFQHSTVMPVLNRELCTGCGICGVHCPESAITIERFANRDNALCTGCGECLGWCPEGAWRVSWDQDMETFMRRMTDFAWAVSSASNPVLFVNFVIDVVPDCDCMQDTGAPLVDDIGVLASADPVALDRACLDLVTAAPASVDSQVDGIAGRGDDKFRALRPAMDGELQLRMAEAAGLGSREYELAVLR